MTSQPHETGENPFDLNNIAYVPTTGVHNVFETKLIQATTQSLEGYGSVVDSPNQFPIEIVRWPAQGWRPVDENSGDQGGTTEGIFELWWKGDTLYARNNAVGDNYLFAWGKFPEKATNHGAANPRERALIFHANYHPDGGQIFFPSMGRASLSLLLCQEMISRLANSLAFCAMGVKAYILIRISGMGPSYLSMIIAAYSIVREKCMRGFP